MTQHRRTVQRPTVRRRVMGIAVAVIALFLIIPLITVGLSWRRPTLGPVDGQLRPCPDSPNCVCSVNTDEAHAIAPLHAGDVPQTTFDRLRDLLSTLPGVRVIQEEGPYLRAEFTTRLLHYTDDVEFLLDEEVGVIHVRSASRIGHSDLGANRQRIEDLRDRLQRSAPARGH